MELTRMGSPAVSENSNAPGIGSDGLSDRCPNLPLDLLRRSHDAAQAGVQVKFRYIYTHIQGPFQYYSVAMVTALAQVKLEKLQ